MGVRWTIHGLMRIFCGRLEEETSVGFGKMYGLWVNGNSLANLFPRLYLISEQKEELIEVMGCWRGPFEWESGLIQQVKALVETILVNKDESDYWKWSRCG